MRGLDPAYAAARSALEVRKARHPVASPDGMEGGRRHPRLVGQARCPLLAAPPQGDHSALYLGRGLGRASSRPARAVLECGPTTCFITPPPLMGGLAGDPHGLSRRSDRPTVFDQTAQAESTLRGERSVTVHSEPPWLVWVCRQLHTASEAHFIWGFSASTRSMGRTSSPPPSASQTFHSAGTSQQRNAAAQLRNARLLLTSRSSTPLGTNRLVSSPAVLPVLVMLSRDVLPRSGSIRPVYRADFRNSAQLTVVFLAIRRAHTS